MTKAIEHAQWCQNHSNGMYGDQVTAMKDEFLRLAAVEQENAKLVKELAESKLHALNGWQRYEMANSMSNSLQQELAACKSRCNAAVGQADALRQELADLKAAMGEPVAWYCIRGDENGKFLGKCVSMNDPKSTNPLETVTPLYVIYAKAAK